MFRESIRSNVHKAMRAQDKPRAKQSLPDIQGINIFQGKCCTFGEAFCPANVATPLSIPAGWLAHPVKAISYMCNLVRVAEI